MTAPADRHGGPGAGWYVPCPDGWQRITDAEASEHRYPDMAHFMHDPNEDDLSHASEGDTGLIGDLDAAHWAARFRSKWIIIRAPGPGETILGFKAAEERTEGVMLAWFASAIETGRMANGTDEAAP